MTSALPPASGATRGRFSRPSRTRAAPSRLQSRLWRPSLRHPAPPEDAAEKRATGRGLSLRASPEARRQRTPGAPPEATKGGLAAAARMNLCGAGGVHRRCLFHQSSPRIPLAAPRPMMRPLAKRPLAKRPLAKRRPTKRPLAPAASGAHPGLAAARRRDAGGALAARLHRRQPDHHHRAHPPHHRRGAERERPVDGHAGAGLLVGAGGGGARHGADLGPDRAAARAADRVRDAGGRAGPARPRRFLRGAHGRTASGGRLRRDALGRRRELCRRRGAVRAARVGHRHRDERRARRARLRRAHRARARGRARLPHPLRDLRRDDGR